MTLSRRLRRAHGLHRRSVPDDAAALVFTRTPDGEGDVYEVHYMAPVDAKKRALVNGSTPDHARLALACAEYAHELLAEVEDNDDGQTTTAAPSGAADVGAERAGEDGDDGEG